MRIKLIDNKGFHKVMVHIQSTGWIESPLFIDGLVFDHVKNNGNVLIFKQVEGAKPRKRKIPISNFGRETRIPTVPERRNMQRNNTQPTTFVRGTSSGDVWVDEVSDGPFTEDRIRERVMQAAINLADSQAYVNAYTQGNDYVIATASAPTGAIPVTPPTNPYIGSSAPGAAFPPFNLNATIESVRRSQVQQHNEETRRTVMENVFRQTAQQLQSPPPSQCNPIDLSLT